MDTDAIKSILSDLKENPEDAFAQQDDLDRIIQMIISIERKHLHQIESPSVAKRRRDVRELIESELPKMLGRKDDS